MESIIKHYQVAHVGFSLSYPDSSQEMMAVLLEPYQAFECEEQVASAACRGQVLGGRYSGGK